MNNQNLPFPSPQLKAVALACQWLASTLLLAGCAQVQPLIPESLPVAASENKGVSQLADKNRATELTTSKLPVPTELPKSKFAQDRDARQQRVSTERSEQGGEMVAAMNLQQVPLPTFIQVVYAEVLKRNLNIDPAVLTRKELVTFRSGASQSAREFDDAMRLLLKSYKLAVIDAGGLLRVVPDTAQLGDVPEINRDEVNSDSPLPLRPLYQFVEMKVVRQNEVANWLKTLYADRLKVQEDIARNALVISGTPDVMRAALETIRLLDQPLMSGRKSVALTPAYWSADDLTKRLTEVLTIQGYAVAPVGQAAMIGGVRYPVVLLPVPGVNSVYVFANSDEVLAHVVNWAKTLDKPNERGVGKNFFTYTVKHKDAGDLAKTLDQLLSGRRGGAAVATPNAGAAAAPAQRLSSVVVDQSSNTLIFQAEPDEYSQISALLQMLDRPAKSALIEVTVAELTLSDEKASGVEWLYKQVASNGSTSNLGVTSYGTAATAPLSFTFTNGSKSVSLALKALAASNRVSILSSPRIHARNGEQAQIQVGSEVPIKTSALGTQTSNSTTGTSVLTTYQYRTAGVLLKVKPVIHSGDQIDLEVEQEVSSADSTSTGVDQQPVFSTRRLATKLTLQNGSTVLMGGLITDNSSRGSGGVPWLKDVPVLGGLFGSQSAKGDRRELVLLITPYILNDAHDAELMTDAFRKMLGPWAAKQATGAQPAGSSAEPGAAAVLLPESKPAEESAPGPKR